MRTQVSDRAVISLACVKPVSVRDSPHACIRSPTGNPNTSDLESRLASPSSVPTITLSLLATSTGTIVEQPAVRFVELDVAFESREYVPYFVAETRVEASFAGADSATCRGLSRCRRGNNSVRQQIATTAPVLGPLSLGTARTSPRP
jgi:hypothetical protein